MVLSQAAEKLLLWWLNTSSLFLLDLGAAGLFLFHLTHSSLTLLHNVFHPFLHMYHTGATSDGPSFGQQWVHLGLTGTVSVQYGGSPWSLLTEFNPVTTLIPKSPLINPIWSADAGRNIQVE